MTMKNDWRDSRGRATPQGPWDDGARVRMAHELPGYRTGESIGPDYRRLHLMRPAPPSRSPMRGYAPLGFSAAFVAALLALAVL